MLQCHFENDQLISTKVWLSLLNDPPWLNRKTVKHRQETFFWLKNLCDFFFLFKPQNQLLHSQFTNDFSFESNRFVVFLLLACLPCYDDANQQQRASARSRNVLSLKRRRSPWMNEKFFLHFITSLNNTKKLLCERVVHRWNRLNDEDEKARNKSSETLFEAIKKIESC